MQSIICHIGEYNLGHFLTYSRYLDGDQEGWALYDSEEIIKVDIDQVLEADEVYALMYQR